MSGRLEGRIAAITGAGSGTGRAAAGLFASEGAAVALLELDATAGEAAAQEVRAQGGTALSIPTDITSETSVAAAFDAVQAELGGLHVLFNCAGGSRTSDTLVTRMQMDELDFAIALNLRGTLLCCRAGMPLIRASGGGSVVNVGTATAIRGGIWPADAYTAAKGGVVAVTRSLAADYAQFGIRTNVICPGMVRSERLLRGNLGRAGVLDTGDIEPLLVDFARYPFAAGDPIDLARIALFLASDESRMINGAVIPADGGLSAY